MKTNVLYSIIVLLALSVACKKTTSENKNNTTENHKETVEITQPSTTNDTKSTPEESDGFIEITPEKVPRKVTAVLMRDYPDADINKILVNVDKEIYQLDGSDESDGSTVRYYVKADGIWLLKDEDGNFVEKTD